MTFLIPESQKIITKSPDTLEIPITEPEEVKTFHHKIDDNPDPETYIQKSAVINKNNLIIGSNKGEIFIYDLDTGLIEKSFGTDGIPINCSPGFSNNTYFIGNNSGKIYFFKFAEVK